MSSVLRYSSSQEARKNEKRAINDHRTMLNDRAVHAGFAPIMVLGAWGSPIPKKVKITVVIGKPIEVPRDENPQPHVVSLAAVLFLLCFISSHIKNKLTMSMHTLCQQCIKRLNRSFFVCDLECVLLADACYSGVHEMDMSVDYFNSTTCPSVASATWHTSLILFWSLLWNICIA